MTDKELLQQAYGAFYTMPPKKEWVGLTTDDITRIAKEAGWEMDDSCVLEPQVVWYISQGQLERFANLVAAAEREACAALCFQMWNEWMNSRVGDQTLDNSNCPDAEDCAAAIRARGDALTRLNKAAEDNGEEL